MSAASPQGSPGAASPAVELRPLRGLPEVTAGADLPALLLAALAADGLHLAPGDCLVVSSKVVSKALGLTWAGDRAGAVAAHTVRVVAEREGSGGPTRVVEATAGPVMAAAGVDASNTGPTGAVLLLPEDPDGEALALRAVLLAAAGLGPEAAVGVVLSDTAGRPWRAGQTDFALGAAGLAVLDDLRGGVDADGRELAVTARAVADEVAAAADLVKGKADGVPAALVRGLPRAWFTGAGDGVGEGGGAGQGAGAAGGARALVRTGPGDWFARGPVETLRAVLGVEPGSAASDEVGLRSVAPEELGVRVGRVVALALRAVEEGSADVALGAGAAEVTLAAPDDYDLGRLVVRCEVAAASEDLAVEIVSRAAGSVSIRLT
ncbi:coenzyme F420-0:L-glutamate ligase [Phycicoccus duodecadis]|uniref:Coenzyme F420-0:L-glutamate ligase/coenzyme F420-1:gamma-L-glutamate ligase n=1 Tax=Phycicoccus duodecadis TaxID=173053 RepID=A0A2N3YK11_9MICO|nr:coenzyme F420-0:L-glutamate ligase [Phycicoccus duodecadis]PKW27201.1 coenzyme F420-0:L-glutamate ligase/coenzyme F420-1:gamma-L-glutamate ligase [Phycicoccus duodecadis]